MTNADKFKGIFGLYATELWAKPEKEFLEWLNEEVPETTVGDTISRNAAIDTLNKGLDKIPMVNNSVNEMVRRDERILCIDELMALPSAQRKGKWMFSPDHAEGICTCCNYKIYGRPYQNTYLIVPYNYCPNCGAEMKGEEDEHIFR